MPTPERTTLDAIVAAAAEILESEGLGGVTMQAVAQRVGVRAPSLYKRVESRDTLLRLVAEATLREYAVGLDGITAELAGEDDALEAARTLTAWATGFVSMEINGAFTLGGDVERAWRFGRDRVVAALRAETELSGSEPTPRPRGTADDSQRSR